MLYTESHKIGWKNSSSNYINVVIMLKASLRFRFRFLFSITINKRFLVKYRNTNTFIINDYIDLFNFRSIIFLNFIQTESIMCFIIF